ncbi:MAG: MBL fold metallo-hydrolase [Candidatus Tectomicrobia bacterium]|nr:MBL fold metallo-hydrolase [Candidatus Tectomicrobia bacterium]
MRNYSGRRVGGTRVRGAALLVILAAVLGLFLTPAWGQLPAGMKPYEVTQIAPGVYSFRAFFHRNLFIVTPAGVIVTDPISTAAAKELMAEIRKITQAPIKYVIYSHSHWDHATGGQIFKEAGARFISQANCLPRFKDRPNPEVVIPDGTYTTNHTIRLGGKTVRLLYFGPNHSNCMTILHLPKERLAFAVDFFSPGSLPYRGLYDTYPQHVIASLKKLRDLDVDRIVPGHGPPALPKAAVNDVLGYWEDLMAAVTDAYNRKVPLEKAQQEIKLEKYAQWRGYEWLPLQIDRIYFWLRLGY